MMISKTSVQLTILEKNPCKTKQCKRNEMCYVNSTTGKADCKCDTNFRRENGRCVPSKITCHNVFEAGIKFGILKKVIRR